MPPATADDCLSPKLQSVVDAIRKCVDQHGRTPVLRELAGTLGLSRSTVYTRVRALQGLGVIRRAAPGSAIYTFVDPSRRKLPQPPQADQLVMALTGLDGYASVCAQLGPALPLGTHGNG